MDANCMQRYGIKLEYWSLGRFGLDLGLSNKQSSSFDSPLKNLTDFVPLAVHFFMNLLIEFLVFLP